MPDQKTQVIATTIDFVRSEIEAYDSGHDWHHIRRVWELSTKIAKKEECDLMVVELAALLHDVGDHKFHNGNENVGAEKVSNFLGKLAIDEEDAQHIVRIVRHISFKGGHPSSFRSKEFDIVRDADRLDAIGAIGIARAFNYGGYMNMAIYDPSIPPRPDQSKAEYLNSKAPTINHFYEKLLLLKDSMKTQTAKEMADQRHEFMLDFLDQFYREWEENKEQSN